jgi:hypothetical protein
MIDYSIIDASIKHYAALGFARIESPWTVTKAVSDITRPPNAKEFALKHEDGKVLVASGEQSFLYLYLKGFLPKGRFQTVTPCFRHESFDGLHTKYFIKNELIITDKTTRSALDEVIENALDFFSKFFPRKGLRIITGPRHSFDIVYGEEGYIGEVELGSYGVRRCEFLTWIYATGCAEPRTSATMKKYGISS